jgi:hypothetical protein
MNVVTVLDDHLVPVRLVVPDFLPESRDVAKRMVNDLHESEYCTDAWVMEDEWGCNEIHSALKLMDWGKALVLEYDWEELDAWGEKKHDPFEIWTDVSVCANRAKGLEPFICGDEKKAEKYAKLLARVMWSDWTAEELMRSPCWMFYYAKNVCKGRLPEMLDNCMTMKSFEDSENQWVRRYFGTKRYRTRNKKALSQISWAA